MAKKWREVRGARALNEARVETYRRLMDAEAQVAELCRSRGISEAQLAEALAASQPTGSEAEDDDVYLATLARYVAALGGHLEVRVVLGGEAVTVLRSDHPADGGTASSEPG